MLVRENEREVLAVVACFTADEVVKSDFLFVSYNHGDKAIVDGAVQFLLEAGVRLWYDDDLAAGVRWDEEKVEPLLRDPNCRGVIFFNSIKSYTSGPVAKERRVALERYEAGKQTDTPFFIFPVNIGKPSTLRMLKSVFESLSDNDAELEQQFPLPFMETIAALFSSNLIFCYVDPENEQGFYSELLKGIEKAIPTAVSLSARPTAGGGGGTPYYLGRCRGTPLSGIPAAMLAKDGVITWNGEECLVERGVAYALRKIPWRLLYREKDTLFLLADCGVSLRGGGPDLTAWLRGEFTEQAFSAEERALLTGEVGLLKPSDFERIEDKSLLVLSPESPDGDSHWWIDASRGALQQVVRADGTVYTMGYNIRLKKSFVRPVIRVDAPALAAYAKSHA